MADQIADNRCADRTPLRPTKTTARERRMIAEYRDAGRRMDCVPVECACDGCIAQYVSVIEVMQWDKQDRHAAKRIGLRVALDGAHGVCPNVAPSANVDGSRDASRALGATTKRRWTALYASPTIDLHFSDDISPMLRRTVFVTITGIALFGGSTVSAETTRPPGPVMMVHFDYYPKDLFRIHILEYRLEAAIKRAGVGELGETEFHLDGNDGYLYMYGPDAAQLDAVVSPILKSSTLMTDAEVTKKYGSRTETSVIHPDGKR